LCFLQQVVGKINHEKKTNEKIETNKLFQHFLLKLFSSSYFSKKTGEKNKSETNKLFSPLFSYSIYLSAENHSKNNNNFSTLFFYQVDVDKKIIMKKSKPDKFIFSLTLLFDCAFYSLDLFFLL
jgi:hypothetical protein